MSASENSKPPGCWQLAFFLLLFVGLLVPTLYLIGHFSRPADPVSQPTTRPRPSPPPTPPAVAPPPIPTAPATTPAAGPANASGNTAITDPYLPLQIVGGTFAVLLVPILVVVVADHRRKRRERAEAARQQQEEARKRQQAAERQAVKDREREERRQVERVAAEAERVRRAAEEEARQEELRDRLRRQAEEKARREEERHRREQEAAAIQHREQLAAAARQALWDLQSRYLAVAGVVQPALPEARFRELYTPLLSSADHAAVLRAAAALALQVDHAEILCDLLAHYHALEADLDGLYSRDFLEQVMRRFLGSADDLALARLRAQELKAELTRAAERPHPPARRRADERKAEAEVAAMRAEMTAKYAGLFPPDQFERAVREKAALIRRKYGLPEDPADD